MSGWITVGLGAAAALCPLPGVHGATVVVDTTPTTAHLVVCAEDGWIEIGATSPQPTAVPSPSPAVRQPPRAPTTPAPRVAVGHPAPPPSAAPQPPPTERRPVSMAVPAPAPEAERADDLVAAPPVPSPAPRAAPFRWVPRFHYGRPSARPAPAGLSTTMSTVVITTPAVLAAAALRPGSRRRNSG